MERVVVGAGGGTFQAEHALACEEACHLSKLVHVTLLGVGVAEPALLAGRRVEGKEVVD